MTSMTGYAYEEKNYESAVVSVEIKSVNSRFLDLTVNLPPYLNPLESYFRNKITEKVFRGKVDVYIRIKELESNPDITVDEGAVKAYSEAVKKVIKASGFGTDSEAALNFILSQPGVIVSNRSYDMDKYKAIIDPVFDSVLEKFNADRTREGENMKRDLQQKLEKLSECAKFFTEWQPKRQEMFKEQITTKFRE